MIKPFYQIRQKAKVLTILFDWDVIGLLDQNIKISKKYLRGLSWIRKLEGNLILYLIKDSNSLELTSKRFFINSKESKILKDYLNLKKDLDSNPKKFAKFSPSKWTKFIEDNNFDIETIKLIIADSGIFWRSFCKTPRISRNPLDGLKPPFSLQPDRYAGWRPVGGRGYAGRQVALLHAAGRRAEPVWQTGEY